jgi:hypothetical protein
MQQMMMQGVMMGNGNQTMNPQMQQMMTMQQNGANSAMLGSMNNPNTFNSMMHGMQNMNMGNLAPKQSNDDGFGFAPMGGNGPQQNMKNDPFSSLGGMNAFR